MKRNFRKLKLMMQQLKNMRVRKWQQIFGHLLRNSKKEIEEENSFESTKSQYALLIMNGKKYSNLNNAKPCEIIS